MCTLHGRLPRAHMARDVHGCAADGLPSLTRQISEVSSIHVRWGLKWGLLPEVAVPSWQASARKGHLSEIEGIRAFPLLLIFGCVHSHGDGVVCRPGALESFSNLIVRRRFCFHSRFTIFLQFAPRFTCTSMICRSSCCRFLHLR